MFRRKFLQGLMLFLPTAHAGMESKRPFTPSLANPSRRILIQESPLAGFQYHAGESLWPLLSVGARLKLAREPLHPRDSRAVAVHFGSQRIGYLPRLENTAASQMLDRGEPLRARITALAQDSDPWKRVRLAVELVVA